MIGDEQFSGFRKMSVRVVSVHRQYRGGTGTEPDKYGESYIVMVRVYHLGGGHSEKCFPACTVHDLPVRLMEAHHFEFEDTITRLKER